MSGGGGGDRAHVLSLAQDHRLPGPQPLRVPAKTLGAGDRCQHLAGSAEAVPRAEVEVVLVLIMAQENGGDSPQAVQLERRAGGLGRANQRKPEVVMPARRIEGGVGQQPELTNLDQRRGATDVGDRAVQGHYDLTATFLRSPRTWSRPVSYSPDRNSGDASTSRWV